MLLLLSLFPCSFIMPVYTSSDLNRRHFLLLQLIHPRYRTKIFHLSSVSGGHCHHQLLLQGDDCYRNSKLPSQVKLEMGDSYCYHSANLDTADTAATTFITIDMKFLVPNTFTITDEPSCDEFLIDILFSSWQSFSFDTVVNSVILFSMRSF